MIGLEHYASLAAALFATGLAGLVLARGRVVALIVSVELILAGAALNFAAYGAFYQVDKGAVFVLVGLAITGVELLLAVTLLRRARRLYEARVAQDAAALEEAEEW
ncbi:MAG: NADH-quinone oxidoreductase subunit K [Rhodobacterales bacterium]|nr:MAG: NADH-quinone oxidoreductase subunit K [Rhodobacterales bacterium]